MKEDAPEPEPSVLEKEGAQPAALPMPSDANSHPDLELTKDKAWDMALAGKEHSDDVAKLRELGGRARKVLGELEEEADKLPGFSGRKEQVKARQEVSRQQEHIRDLEKAERRSRHLEAKDADKAGEEYERDFRSKLAD